MRTLSKYARNQLVALGAIVALVAVSAFDDDGALGKTTLTAVMVILFGMQLTMDRHTIAGGAIDERQQTLTMRSHALAFRILQAVIVVGVIVANWTDAPDGLGLAAIALAFGLPLLTAAWVERTA